MTSVFREHLLQWWARHVAEPRLSTSSSPTASKKELVCCVLPAVVAALVSAVVKPKLSTPAEARPVAGRRREHDAPRDGELVVPSGPMDTISRSHGHALRGEDGVQDGRYLARLLRGFGVLHDVRARRYVSFSANCRARAAARWRTAAAAATGLAAAMVAPAAAAAVGGASGAAVWAAGARAAAGLGRAVVGRGACTATVAAVWAAVAGWWRRRGGLGRRRRGRRRRGEGGLARAAVGSGWAAAGSGWAAAGSERADGAKAAATAERAAGEGRTPPRCRGCARSARRSSGAAAASDR